MPANLPPQYFETEKKLKTARTPQEKVKILEELLSIVPKHKGTEKLQALLKTKIAKLRSSTQKRPAVARHGPSYVIDKSGAGQIAVVGPPNAGKSMLIKSLTGAEPEVGDYPFTTRISSPYMMKFENIQIQLVDTPPVSVDFMETGIAELIKNADGVICVVDAGAADAASSLESFLLKLKEKKIELVSESTAIPPESQSFVKKAIIVANKCDHTGAEENLADVRLFFEDRFTVLPVSAAQGDGLGELKRKIITLLDIIRVYSKIPGKKADFDEPFTLKKGSTVLDMAHAVHKDFVQNFRYARIWKKNAYQGQMVNREQVLEDEDIVELHI